MFEPYQTDSVNSEMAEDSGIAGTTAISRYASLGLNGHPLRSLDQISISAKGIYSPLNPPEHSGPLRKIRRRTWLSEDEDLAELADTMFEGSIEPCHPIRNNLLKQSQQSSETRMSKFTTGYLTESGWQGIKNPYWDTEWIEKYSKKETDARVSQLAMDKVLRSDLDKEGMNVQEVKDKDDAFWSLMNDKYFDHDGYLDYLLGKKTEEVNKSIFQSSRGAEHKNFHWALPTAPEKSHDGGTDSVQDIADVFSNTCNIIDEYNEVEASAENLTDRWEILDGDIEPPCVGEAAIDKLTVRLRETETQELKTFSFRKLEHEDIDWANKSHVQEIHKWRYQILRRHGIAKPKSIVMYSPEEDDWLVLYHKKLKVTVEAGNIVKMPGPLPTMEAFNSFFEGKMLKDKHGADLPPRPPRDETSMKHKIGKRGSALWKLRDVTKKLLEGKHGHKLYVPVITEDELRRYQQDNTVTTDDPNDVDKNAALCADSRRTLLKRKHDDGDDDQERKHLKPT